MLIVLLILIVILFGGGGFYGFNSGMYGAARLGGIGIVGLLLILWLVIYGLPATW